MLNNARIIVIRQLVALTYKSAYGSLRLWSLLPRFAKV